VIRIDTLWLAFEPMDMRAGAEPLGAALQSSLYGQTSSADLTSPRLLRQNPGKRVSRGTAPHTGYEVIDSTLPVDTDALYGCGEVEDASRQRQTSARLRQLVQGSVLQVLGKQRIVDSGRSAAALGQQARAAQPLNRCAHLGYSRSTAVDLRQ